MSAVESTIFQQLEEMTAYTKILNLTVKIVEKEFSKLKKGQTNNSTQGGFPRRGRIVRGPMNSGT